MNRLNISTEEIARYIIETGATRRQAAEHFGCHFNAISKRLANLTGELKEQVDVVAKANRKKKPATICESGESTVTVTQESEVYATGHRVGGNAHPLIDLTTGDVYTSSVDAAETLGVHQTAMSWHITGRSQTCRGHKFIKVSDAQSNISAISGAIKSANAKAEKAEADKTSEIEAIRAETNYLLQTAAAINAEMNEARQEAVNAAIEAENKYNALAERLAAIATLDKEIAELEQRLAEAKTNRETAYNNLFK